MVQRLAAIRVGVDMASPVLEQLVRAQPLDGGPVEVRQPGAEQGHRALVDANRDLSGIDLRIPRELLIDVSSQFKVGFGHVALHA